MAVNHLRVTLEPMEVSNCRNNDCVINTENTALSCHEVVSSELQGLDCISGADDSLLDNAEPTDTMLKEDSTFKWNIAITSQKVDSEVDGDKMLEFCSSPSSFPEGSVDDDNYTETEYSKSCILPECQNINGKPGGSEMFVVSLDPTQLLPDGNMTQREGSVYPCKKCDRTFPIQQDRKSVV
jgi:hypothetical protein